MSLCWDAMSSRLSEHPGNAKSLLHKTFRMLWVGKGQGDALNGKLALGKQSMSHAPSHATLTSVNVQRVDTTQSMDTERVCVQFCYRGTVWRTQCDGLKSRHKWVASGKWVGDKMVGGEWVRSRCIWMGAYWMCVRRYRLKVGYAFSSHMAAFNVISSACSVANPPSTKTYGQILQILPLGDISAPFNHGHVGTLLQRRCGPVDNGFNSLLAWLQTAHTRSTTIFKLSMKVWSTTTPSSTANSMLSLLLLEPSSCDASIAICEEKKGHNRIERAM